MKTSEYVQINILDLTVLLWHVFHAADDDEIGYVDPEMALEELVASCGRHIPIKTELVEKLLFSANMLDEKDRFWHYNKKSFDELVTDLGVNYNRSYGWID